MTNKSKHRRPDLTLRELEADLLVEATLHDQQMRFHTTWGLFSPRTVDEGSALLLKYVEVAEDDALLDLGCGWGALGLTLAKCAPKGRATLVDKDFIAVDYARKNATLNGLDNCECLLSNGLAHIPQDARFDLVVSNLPAKVGREQLTLFLGHTRKRLNPGGRVVVVTINGLRKFIKRSFLEHFGNYDKLKQGRAYTVALATIQ